MTSVAAAVKGFRREEKQVIAQGAPVDFSFRHALTLSELEKERPRACRVRQMPTRGGTLKYLTRSVWLNNNNLTTIEGLDKFVTNVLEQPSALAWIDLSFNNLSDVPDEFVHYPNLRILYLHGNSINALCGIEKLRRLQRLLSITFHGNPIEFIPSYRGHVINILPQIRNLDFSPVVPAEKESVPPLPVAAAKKTRSKL